MLVSITMYNVLSFGSETTFSLVPMKGVRTHSDHIVKTKTGNKRILRGAIIFGPNAAGKSNLLKGIDLLTKMVDQNSCQVASGFQFALGRNKRSAMNWVVDYSFGEHVFRYSLSTNGKIVLSEKLFSLGDADERLLFSRFYKRQVVRFNSEISQVSWYSQRTLTPDALLIRKFELDGIYSQPDNMPGKSLFINALKGLQSIMVIHSRSVIAPDVFKTLVNLADFRNFLKTLMQKSDIGITDMSWQKISPSKLKYIVNHTTRGSSGIQIQHLRDSFVAIHFNGERIIAAFEFRFSHGGHWMPSTRESEGTLRLMHLSAFLYTMSLREATWFVDELDCHLHPYLSRGLLKMALNQRIDSQLIVTAHDTNLMDKKLWRTDEVWLVEKRIDGSTNMNNLRQLRAVISKKMSDGYINGVYGAIPNVGGNMI